MRHMCPNMRRDGTLIGHRHVVRDNKTLFQNLLKDSEDYI